MIPYYQPPSYTFGPFTIEVFGAFVALGVYVGARLSASRAQRLGLDPRPVLDYAIWGVLSGIVVGHMVHIFLYHQEELRDPWRILKIWSGLSSFGGLLGGTIAAIIFFRQRGLRLTTYGDAFALGSAPGWAIARLGCFAVHDHPGIKTAFWLGVQYPGGARHDLGLYDALWLIAIAIILHLIARRGLLKNRLLPLFGVLYGVARFYFDTLRATDLPYIDARYWGLTPAQYACFLLVGWGLWRLATNKPVPAPALGSGASKQSQGNKARLRKSAG